MKDTGISSFFFSKSAVKLFNTAASYDNAGNNYFDSRRTD